MRRSQKKHTHTHTQLHTSCKQMQLVHGPFKKIIPSVQENSPATFDKFTDIREKFYLLLSPALCGLR